MTIKNAQQVAEWRLCTGCGACACACPDGNISLVDIVEDGIRPRVDSGRCKGCGACISVCPGIELTRPMEARGDGPIAGLKMSWGTVLELWEGYAADPEIRHNGSSGGLASALALYCIEVEGMHGLLHVGPDKAVPYLNRTVLSGTRDEILATTGSRYAPASPCDGLDKLDSAPGPCVFIGKPCDIAAVRKSQSARPGLDGKLGLAIGIFCAGTPSTKGTLDLLRSLRVDPENVEELRYRGRGWPGRFSVKFRGDGRVWEAMSYTDAWGFVQKYRPYRCHLCPDATSEFADISCGDPWYRRITEGEHGHSLVLVRTERGRSILKGAIESGYVTLERVSPSVLEASQPGMPAKKGMVWGRVLAMKAFGIPVPKLEGFSLSTHWLGLTIKDKARSVLGTVRRIIKRKYYTPARITG